MSVACFSNQGGKQHALFTLRLAESFGASVLVVDADPECYLTAMIRPPKVRVLQDLTNPDDEKIIQGFEYDSSCNSQVEEIWPDGLYQTMDAMMHKSLDQPLPKIHRYKENVSVVCGHPHLIMLENSVHFGIKELTFSDIRKHGAFRHLIQRLIKETKCQYVLVHVGPGTGVLNRMMVMSCDYILPCVGEQTTSVASVVCLLSALLPSWIRQRRYYIACQNKIEKVPPTLALPIGSPRLLPVMIRDFICTKDQHLSAESAKYLKAVATLMSVGLHGSIIKSVYVRSPNKMLVPFLQVNPNQQQLTKQYTQLGAFVRELTQPKSLKRMNLK